MRAMLFSVALLVCPALWAQDTQPTTQPVTQPSAWPMMKGDVAPVDGVLLSEQRIKELLVAEMDAEECVKKNTVCEEALKKAADIADTCVKTCPQASKQWYENPLLAFGVGAILGAVGTTIVILGWIAVQGT